MCAMAIVAGRATWTVPPKSVSTSSCPSSRSVRRRARNVHPQTLRQYDRLGLVVPQRTEGGARRYSLRDISRLAQAQQLSQEEGINLAGITRILELEEENRELRRQVERLRKPAGSSVFAADADGGIVESSGPSARACGAGSCEPMHGSFRRANPYGRNVRKRGTIWAPSQW